MTAVSSSWQASSMIWRLIRTAKITDQRSRLRRVATAFIESWKVGSQCLLMQAEKMILSRFANQLLIDGDGDHFTVAKAGSWTRTFQDLLNHC